MKYLYYLLLITLFFQGCKKDGPKGEISETKKVKLLIYASPGVFSSTSPVAIQISGTHIQTRDNVTGPNIIEAEYPVGEPQTVTVTATKGDPDLYLEVGTELTQEKWPSVITRKIGRGTISTTFYPEDLSAPATATEGTGEIILNGAAYPVVEIGTQLWTARDFTSYRQGSAFSDHSDTTINDGRFYTTEEAEKILLPGGWRIPTSTDLQKLRTATGNNLSNILQNGKWYSTMSNSSKLSLYPTLKQESSVRLSASYMIKNPTAYSSFFIQQYKSSSSAMLGTSAGSVEGVKMSLRFVRDK
jgi:uncharacterized protein (TIGR02145 family)